MTMNKQEQPQEILQRLRKIQDEELKDALASAALKGFTCSEELNSDVN